MSEYIDREAALMKLMQDGCSAKNLQSISDIPAADVAPVVHAQWIEDESGIIICPECKRGYNLIAKFTNYCPACGAKMDGKEGANADNHD
jgi:hypothetical protein